MLNVGSAFPKQPCSLAARRGAAKCGTRTIAVRARSPRLNHAGKGRVQAACGRRRTRSPSPGSRRSNSAFQFNWMERSRSAAGDAAGRGPVTGEVQAKVQAMLAAKVFPQDIDRRGTSETIEPDEVTATVADYRPIYVNGDVFLKPGEQVLWPADQRCSRPSPCGGCR